MSYRKFEKHYGVILENKPPKPEGTLTNWIEKDKVNKKVEETVKEEIPKEPKFSMDELVGNYRITFIKDAIEIIKEKHGVEIIADDIPLDNVKTYELFQKGLTTGVFQFESPGMKKHLINLVPDKFEDLIVPKFCWFDFLMAYSITLFITSGIGRHL